jgi:hypothetical protein
MKKMNEKKNVAENSGWHSKKINGSECFFSENGEYRVSAGVENEWICCKLFEGEYRDLGVRTHSSIAMRMFIDLKLKNNKKIRADKNPKKTVRDFILWRLKIHYSNMIERLTDIIESSEDPIEGVETKLKIAKKYFDQLSNGKLNVNGNVSALNEVFVDYENYETLRCEHFIINSNSIEFVIKGIKGYSINFINHSETPEKKNRKQITRRKKVTGLIEAYVKKNNTFVCDVDGNEYVVSAADYLADMIAFVKMNKTTTFNGYLKGDVLDIEEYDL